jgi:hypothetical protein
MDSFRPSVARKRRLPPQSRFSEHASGFSRLFLHLQGTRKPELQMRRVSPPKSVPPLAKAGHNLRSSLERAKLLGNLWPNYDQVRFAEDGNAVFREMRERMDKP